MSDPAIAVLPHGNVLGPHLAAMPLAELDWPLGCPDRLEGGTVGDLAPDDHLLIFPKTSAHYVLRRGTRARISLIMGEPAVIHAKHHWLLRFTHRRFHRVLTFSQNLVDDLPNARFLPYGTTWVPNWRDLDLTKSHMCSLIASAKRDTEGHKLRHAIVDWSRQSDADVAIMGRGYQPFEEKSDGLAPFRYAVVIENVQERNYFSEKLVDAVLCDTVPIYWGCPNIGEFMDTSGFVICTSEDEVKAAIAAMSDADFAQRLPAIQAVKSTVAQYCDIERRAAELILSELG